MVRRESVEGKRKSEKSKEGYTTFNTLAVCVGYLPYMHTTLRLLGPIYGL